MYAYVDESGNTGPNIFDEQQPLFLTAAMMTKTNFDILNNRRIREISGSVGCSALHANEFGMEFVEQCAGQILRVLKKADSRFFVSRIQKTYLATAKIVDTLFDSNENKAVPWHIYNYRPLRLMMVFKVAVILEEATARKFWAALMEKQQDKAYAAFLESLRGMLSNVSLLLDESSRTLISEAISWAIENPEAIYIHTNSKAARTGHLPNLAVFPNLLNGIEQRSRLWKRPVREIVHHRQSQFQATLTEWHEIASNASPDVITWMMGEKYSLRMAPGSKFRISSAEDSAGIQVVDMILWLFKRVLEDKPLGPYSADLMRYVFRRGYQNDLSFESVGAWLEEFFADLFAKPFGAEEVAKAQYYLRFAEERRQRQMVEYVESKIKTASNEQMQAAQ